MNILDRFKLDGKVALITGGSRGLGLQMAQAVGEAGAKVVLTSRHMDELQRAKEFLEKSGIEAYVYALDMQDFEAIPAFVDQVIKDVGLIDILFNNAGASWAAPAEKLPKAAWEKVMKVNVDGLFYLSQEVANKCMIPQKSGKIINTSSVTALSGRQDKVPITGYATSKAAVLHLTKCLADEWGKYNINVNAICPGFFPTKMTAGMPDGTFEKIAKDTPLQRVGNDQDLKGLAVFFASGASDFITGQYVAVDGGASL